MWVLICLHYIVVVVVGCLWRKPVSAECTTSPDSSPPQTMVNTQQTSTTVAATSVRMVLYEHARTVSMMCVYTFANVHQVLMPAVCRNVSFRVSASKASK